jgi:hypothetical protein
VVVLNDIVVNGKWFDIKDIGENNIFNEDNASFVADELDNINIPGLRIAIDVIPAITDHLMKLSDDFINSLVENSSFCVM